MENWQLLLCQGCQVWEVGVVWYHQWGSFVCCFLCWWSEGIFLADVFSPFDLLLYGGFVITTAGEVFLQICSSIVVKGLIRQADASHQESLAVGDSFFTVSWVVAVGGNWWVSVGFTYRSVTIHPSTIFTVVSRNDTLSLDHSVVNLMVGWAWLIS